MDGWDPDFCRRLAAGRALRHPLRPPRHGWVHDLAGGPARVPLRDLVEDALGAAGRAWHRPGPCGRGVDGRGHRPGARARPSGPGRVADSDRDHLRVGRGPAPDDPAAARVLRGDATARLVRPRGGRRPPHGLPAGVDGRAVRRARGPGHVHPHAGPGPRRRRRTAPITTIVEHGEAWRSRLGTLRVPTLVVHGERDPLFPPGHGRGPGPRDPGRHPARPARHGARDPTPVHLGRRRAGHPRAHLGRLGASRPAGWRPRRWRRATRPDGSSRLYAGAAAGRDADAVGGWSSPAARRVGVGRPRVTGQRAVVVGAGLGENAELVAGLGYDTLAFDIAPTAVAQARASASHSPRWTTGWAICSICRPSGSARSTSWSRCTRCRRCRRPLRAGPPRR